MAKISYLRLHLSIKEEEESGLEQQELSVLLGKNDGSEEKKKGSRQRQSGSAPEPESA